MKNKSFLLSLLSFSLLIILWALFTHFGNFSDQIFPAPLLVLDSAIELFNSGTLLKHVVASLYRVTLGFYLAVLLGIPLGILLGRMILVRQLVNPIIQFLRPISPLAWIPLAMLWFGIGDKPAIFLIFLSSFFPLVVATTMAVSNINPVYFHVASNFNFSQQEIIKKIIIPAILPEVLTALRLTIAIAWLVVVAAEMIAVQSGLGYLILDARNALRMDIVMVGMIVIGMIGVLLDLIMLRLAAIDSIAWNKES
jgi:NitT/TauT family transport system permease protein